MEKLFEHTTTRTEQGNIGEARAIYEYTKLGYLVSKPLTNNTKYDLIVDDGETLKRVQVKTTQCRVGTKEQYSVVLSTRGGNTKANTVRFRSVADYDELFILTEKNECWMIPAAAFSSISCVVVGGIKYNEFKLESNDPQPNCGHP